MMTPTSEESLNAWFRREILPHEEALLRYLTHIWRNHNEVHDLRQETYLRVCQAASRAKPQQPKAFLLATARHLMTDQFRRRQILAIDVVGDSQSLDIMVDENSPEVRAAVHDELRRLSEALNTLPPKCREVVWLRRVDGLPQKEVAGRLGIAQKTVEKHIRNGMRLLARALFQPQADRVLKKGSALLQ